MCKCSTYQERRWGRHRLYYLIVSSALVLAACGQRFPVDYAIEQNWPGIAAGYQLTSPPSDPEVAFLLAHAQLATNRVDDALRLVVDRSLSDVEQYLARTTRRAKQQPQHSIFAYLRGDALARLGRVQQSLDSLDRALQLDPDFALALVCRAVLHTRRGDLGTAKTDLAKAVDTAPELAVAWIALTVVRAQTGDAKGVAEAAAEATRLAPGSVEAGIATAALREIGTHQTVEVLVSDYGINQNNAEPKNFTYDAHAVYLMPSANPKDLSSSMSNPQVRREVSAAISRLITQNPGAKQVELRIIEDVNTWGYATGSLPWSQAQPRNDAYMEAVIGGIADASALQPMKTVFLASSNAGRAVTRAILANAATGVQPIDSIVFDDAQVKRNEVEQLLRLENAPS